MRGVELLKLLTEPGPVRSAATNAIAGKLTMSAGTCRDRAHTLSGQLLEAAARAAAGELDRKERGD